MHNHETSHHWRGYRVVNAGMSNRWSDPYSISSFTIFIRGPHACVVTTGKEILPLSLWTPGDYGRLGGKQ